VIKLVKENDSVKFENVKLNGFSPLIDVEPVEGGHKLTITDIDGTKTLIIKDGVDGEDGNSADLSNYYTKEETATIGKLLTHNHNIDNDSHSDIRLAIKDTNDKLNKFLNVDDATKDELSEVLQMIADADESGAIEELTVSKVNIADIVDNLTTNDNKKPLSAAQGAVIKKELNALAVEDKAIKNQVSVLVDEDSGKSARNISTEVIKSNAIKTYLLDMFYPIGSVAMNRDSNWNPAVAWGGTWYRIEGKFLIGACADAKEGDSYYVGSVGGSETVTLAVENLPPHTHFIGDENYTLIGAEGSAESAISRGIQYTTKGRGSTLRTNQSSKCDSKPFSILPPYTAVFMWYRVA
jgi:hypothetical protein